AFRRKVRDLDLLVIDDVHFLAGKRATQEEFLHTFNSIEAMGRQVVMASDAHPKMIEEFGESLVNRFVSGMVVRIDPPNYATRCVAMFLVRKTAKLSFPEIGMRMGKRNHSTVISACRRIERAVQKNEPLLWSSAVGDREEEAAELIQRLEEHSRALS